MKKTYNKLIRDKIPEIISESGEKPTVKVLNKKQFKEALRKKLVKESVELSCANNKKEIVNELADITELIDWICREYRLDKNSLKKHRIEKNKKRGSFRSKLFLIKTE